MARAAAPKKTDQAQDGGGAGQDGASGEEGARPAKVAPTKAPAKSAAAAKKAAPGEEAPRPRRPRPRRPLPAKKAPAPKAAPAKKAAPVKKAAPAKKAAAGEEGASAKPEPAKKAARKPTTVICPLSGFEVKPEKPGLSPKTLERLQASLLEERARHVQQADELAGRGRAARGRARGRRHAVRRGVRRGRHHQHRARARPPALGVGPADRRRDRPRARAHREQDLRRCACPPVGASPSSASRRCRTPRPASTARLVPSDAASGTDPTPPSRPTGRPLLATAIVLGVVVLDQLSKLWAVRDLADGADLGDRRRHRLRARPQHRQRVQPVPGVHAVARHRRHRGGGPARAGGAPHARPAHGRRALAGARRRARQPRRPPVPVAGLPAGRGRRLRARRQLPDVQRRRLRDHDRRGPHRDLGGPHRPASSDAPTRVGDAGG